MATSARGKPAGRSDGATLAACLAEARAGTPAPVYLLDGDAFLTGRAARELCLLLEVWLRDVLAVQGAGAAAPLALADLRGATEAAAAALAPADVLRRVDAVRDAAEALLQNGSPALAVERMLIRWFHGDVR